MSNSETFFSFIIVPKSDLLSKTIACLSFIKLIISLSFSSNSFDASATNITKSLFSASSFALFTPICSTTSSESLMPAVSIKLRKTPFKLMLSSRVSLVVPSISVTIALSSPRSKFNKEDFPAFGLPKITVLTPSLTILPLSKLLINLESSPLTSSRILLNLSEYPSMLICSGSSSADSIKAIL